MKTYRSTFEENFIAVEEPCNNRKGFKMRYVYIGLWYVWNLPKERVRTIKWLIGTGCVLSAAVFTLGSLMNSFLNHSRYVELWGALSAAALVFEIFGTAQFCAAKEKMTNMDFDDIKKKMMLAPLLHALLLFGTVAAAVCQLFRNPVTLIDVVVTLCFLVSGVLSLLIFLCYRSLPWRKDKNENTRTVLHTSKHKTEC